MILITPTVQADLAVAVDILVRRGLFPVVVLLDAASFGGAPGTAVLVTAMRALGVPVCPVENGMDLAAALSSAGS